MYAYIALVFCIFAFVCDKIVLLLLDHLFQRRIITHVKATQWNVFLGEQCDSPAKKNPSTSLSSSLMTLLPLPGLHEIRWAAKRQFTHLLVLSEKDKVCNGMVMCALPHGPTAFFKVSITVVGGIPWCRHYSDSPLRVQNIFCRFLVTS